MSLLNALILGLIQGVAEFLPISSSGHLSIAQNLLGLKVEGTEDVFFDVLLHLGTLAAVFVAYWKDIREMILEFFRTIGDFRRGGMP
ncbi:MAG: undecaprenyl-diphosphate phosphatase, partial [Oscillospiraceae bacterium]|nr:undecaprenyl-diphosphate phosphatase [Oscillospiraceae bacterium]